MCCWRESGVVLGESRVCWGHLVGLIGTSVAQHWLCVQDLVGLIGTSVAQHWLYVQDTASWWVKQTKTPELHDGTYSQEMLNNSFCWDLHVCGLTLSWWESHMPQNGFNGVFMFHKSGGLCCVVVISVYNVSHEKCCTCTDFRTGTHISVLVGEYRI